MSATNAPIENTTANANSGCLSRLVRCEDCGQTVSIFEVSEQTTFEGTKIRCESCANAAWKRAIDLHFNGEPSSAAHAARKENHG